MYSGSQFNIITGQILTRPSHRRFHSTQQLKFITKQPDHSLPKVRLPSLGTPKDKNSFQYSYLDPSPSQPHSFSNKKPTTLNFTFQKTDLLTHRQLSPTCTNLQHKDFTNQIKIANVKGILTEHIDKARAYAPNFHDGFEDRVNKLQFHRKKQLCGEVLGIEKGYGGARYFRKFK